MTVSLNFERSKPFSTYLTFIYGSYIWLRKANNLLKNLEWSFALAFVLFQIANVYKRLLSHPLWNHQWEIIVKDHKVTFTFIRQKITSRKELDLFFQIIVALQTYFLLSFCKLFNGSDNVVNQY